MPHKDPEVRRAWQRAHRAKNPEKFREHVRLAHHKNGTTYYRRRRHLAADLRVKHKAGGCVVCGYDRTPEALEFHHIDGTKEGLVSKIRSVPRLLAELEKCVLLCANCHREAHAGLLDPAVLLERKIHLGAKQLSLRLIVAA